MLPITRRPTVVAFAANSLATLAILLASVARAQGTASAQDAADTAQESTAASSGNQPREVVATFAGGCFWCTEAVFERMKGVNDVVSGYIGGDETRFPRPTYKQVLTKITGYAEACEIYYDPKVTTYEELLKVFFKTHDPTTLNRQGNDIGPQYRSAIFFHDAKQKASAEKFIAKLNDSGEFRRPIVTKLEKAGTFFVAEEYHQDYFRRNPNAGYCQAVVKYKVRKFQREFGDKVKFPDR